MTISTLLQIVTKLKKALGLKAPLSPTVRLIVGASGTITQADNGKMIRLNRATTIALTVTGPISSGFNCVLRQAGDGEAEIAGDNDPVSVVNRQSHNLTAGKYAVVSLTCDNDDQEVTFAGDTAA